jgi:hypothetical protein
MTFDRINMIYMIYFGLSPALRDPDGGMSAELPQADERPKSVIPLRGRKFAASYQAYQSLVMGGQVSFSRLTAVGIFDRRD